MHRKFLATTLACAMLCSCASTSTHQATSDATLVPVNPAAESLNVRAVQQQEHEQERLSLMQKIQDLGNELSALKDWAHGKSNIQTAPPPVVAATSPPAQPVPSGTANRTRNKKGKAPLELDSASRETIVLRDTGVIFRVMHGFARTEFQPSKSLQVQLLQAARAGKRVEIRGRTDASFSNEIDREIAMERALNARLFLAKNGIHPRKMRINYMAAGDNVADNATPDGRARNRRVDIETTGITSDVLEDMAAVIRQDIQ